MAATSGIFGPMQGSDQAYLAIQAETKVGRMAGMELPDFGQLPPGIKLPPEALMFSGKPTRVLNVRLWSPSIAPKDAKATLAPPPGLKQGDKLDLDLYRPEGADTGKVQGVDPDSNPNFTIKIYWGSSQTVKEGQPKVITWSTLSPEYKAAMKNQARAANAAGSYFYKEGWTTGYWPTKKQPGSIDLAASLVGKYSLTTTYTGNVDIEAPSNVNFLDAYALSSPNLDKEVDLSKFIPLKWAAIPNVLGQNATIFGMEGKNTMIIWSSSETYTEALMGDTGFMQMADVRENVTKNIFMAPDRTSADVPVGIFKNADMAFLNLTGYGPGSALEKAQPLPRIQTKTNLMVMLGGKGM